MQNYYYDWIDVVSDDNNKSLVQAVLSKCDLMQISQLSHVICDGYFRSAIDIASTGIDM